MKTKIVITLLFTASVAAVDITAAAQSVPQSFKEFREGLLRDYSSFREGVLKDYAKFLENAWVEYDRFKGEERDSTPKPVSAPVAPSEPQSEAIGIPSPVVPESTIAREPEPTLEPWLPQPPEIHSVGDYNFDFYGITFAVPDIKVWISDRLRSSKEFAEQWRALSADPYAATLVTSLLDLARKHRFNDYLTYDLIKKYVDSRYAGVHSTSRMALCHYLLANMGYGARLGLSSTGDGLLLLPFRQMVYGRPYLKINGRRYYVFADSDSSDLGNITTCKLPDDAQTGTEFDLRLAVAPDIPYKAHPFQLSYGDIELTGNVNANLFPMLYRYPQMEMGDYTSVVLDPQLRADIVNQLKSQLDGKTQLDAVNSLLRFTQLALAYATDEQAHGFEKPYFFEETLFYPQCDCEDRAIFYTYLLWNVLGVENQMITYPGHESAAVCLSEPIKGDCYNFDGRTFYISDPTYIGSRTGQCMPDFICSKPEIEHHYK